MWAWIKSLFHKQQDQVPDSHKWEWQVQTKTLLIGQLDTLSLAQDVYRLCPHYNELTYYEKIEVWADLFKWLAYYESAWNPRSTSVDVGEKNDKDTWSIGLLQVSVIDQKNLGLDCGFDYDSLLMPIPNITLGIAIMANQVKKRGKIFIPKGEAGNPGVYWATLHPGGKYDKTEEIVRLVNGTCQ